MMMNNFDRNRLRSGYGALLALIGLNCLIFLFQNGLVEQDFALMVDAVNRGQIWRFLTAVFLHGGFMHLLMNMFGLYVFGEISAPLLGQKKFVWLFLISGIAGNVLWYLLNLDNHFAFLLGASGAVMGVIMAAAMLMPDVPVITLFFPTPVKLKTLAVVYILLEVFSQAVSAGSSVAYLAHIGGFLGGYIYMRFAAPKQIAWDPLRSLFSKKDSSAKMPKGWSIHPSGDSKETSVPPAELERLLIKLAHVGINGLTEEEQETLRRAERDMESRR